MIIQNSIIVFGDGDVGIAARYNKMTNTGELSFEELDVKHEIGEHYESDNNYFPVSLIFKKKESIDAIIKQLQLIKGKMEE